MTGGGHSGSVRRWTGGKEGARRVRGERGVRERERKKKKKEEEREREKECDREGEERMKRNGLQVNRNFTLVIN